MKHSLAPLAALALLGLLPVGGCRKPPPQDTVASYSYSDGEYAETIALRPDGHYTQTETHLFIDHRPPLALQTGINTTSQDYPTLPVARREGTWRLLNKPGGTALALPASSSLLPFAAVIELNSALPYGFLFVGQPPLGYVDRIVPASDFRIKHP